MTGMKRMTFVDGTTREFLCECGDGEIVMCSNCLCIPSAAHLAPGGKTQPKEIRERLERDKAKPKGGTRGTKSKTKPKAERGRASKRKGTRADRTLETILGGEDRVKGKKRRKTRDT